MKRVKESLLRVFLLSYLGIFCTVIFILYFSLHNEENLFMILGVSTVVFFATFALTFYFISRLSDALTQDLDALTEYMEELSLEKNYEASLKTQHFLEFLKIAIIMKNIQKRLYQKEKKLLKK